MTYRAWMTARQLLTEEFIGRHLRAPNVAEDEQFRRSLNHVPRK